MREARIDLGGDGPVTTNPNARLAAFKDYGLGAQILRDLATDSSPVRDRLALPLTPG